MKKLLFIVLAGVLSYAASGWLAAKLAKTESTIQHTQQVKRKSTSRSAFIPEPTRVPDADMVQVPAAARSVPAYDADVFAITPTRFPIAGRGIPFSIPTPMPTQRTDATPSAALDSADSAGISVPSPLYALLLLLRAW